MAVCLHHASCLGEIYLAIYPLHLSCLGVIHMAVCPHHASCLREIYLAIYPPHVKLSYELNVMIDNNY